MPKSDVSAIALWISDHIKKHGYLDCEYAARKVAILFGDQFTIHKILKMQSDRKYFLSRINRFSSKKVFYNEATDRLHEAKQMKDERVFAADLCGDTHAMLPSRGMQSQSAPT